MNTLTTLKTLAIPVTVALLAHSAGAFAAESLANGIKRRAPQGISTKLYACVDKAPDNADAIDACLSTEKTAQDERLDRSYKTLLSRLNGKPKEALVSSEYRLVKGYGRAQHMDIAMDIDGCVERFSWLE
ncbi:hypothetical protein [Ralstonia wenshanensis]|uniref:hypothetical protein n=1 Tax=Ralstonia wenshanensis TaxID=2842456 RepID=UPI0039C66079